MSTDLAGTWESLAEAAVSRAGSGTMSIRIEPESLLEMRATVTSPDERRGLSLTVPADAVAGVSELPATSGLEHVISDTPDGRREILLRLQDATANEMFEALAADLLRTVAPATSQEEGVRLWMGRLALWRRVFAAGRRGLSPNRQRGLYAELFFLRELFEPAVGAGAALAGWQGPMGGRDFQFPGASIEVKSSAATEPQAVRINSERQLDTIGCPRLYLAHVSLAVETSKGETLPQMVASVRDLAAGSTGAALLEDALLSVGYLAVHEHQYTRAGYAIRAEHFFEVREGFPRILEADLPPGVGNVRYDLVLDVCEPFRVDRAEVVGDLLLEGS
jgi:hypothetical protein